jgi:hypothetical protein
MSVSKDKVQISIAFLTDESREYAKLVTQNKQFIKELNEAKKKGDDLSGSINKIVNSAAGLGKIDLTKVAPAQLNERAKQLEQTIRLIPQSAPQYKILSQELKAVNAQISAIRSENRGLSDAKGVWEAMSTGAKGFLSALGPIALAVVGLSSLLEGLKKVFDIGVDAEALKTKMAAVFGESISIVNDFAEKNSAAIGLSRREYRGLATDVADLLTPMGFTQKTAAELSIELVNQAGVLSRWTKGKVDTKTATEILNKALLGERDALNSLGIDVKDSIIQAELKRKGLEKLTGDERRQAEALITLEQITKQSSNANNAFSKGVDDLQEKKARLRARISEIVDGLGTGMIPVFNKVLGAIIPVVEWIVNFGTSIYNLIQGAENFRAVVSAAFGGVASAISGVVKGIGAVADGFVNLFSGEFSKAASSFGSAFENLNPVGVGINLAQGVVDGWKSVKSPQPEIAPADKAAATGEGKGLASAFGGGYDAQFAIIKANSKKSKEQIQKESKEALELELKGLEAATLRKETILEGERLANTKNEVQYGNELVAIKKEQLEQSLLIYKKYAKDQSIEALKLQNELAQMQADNSRKGVAVLSPLAQRQLGPVTSDQAPTNQKLQALAVDEIGQQVQIDAVKNKLVKTIAVEQQYEMQRLQMKRDFLAQEIAILKEGTNPQVDEIKRREDEKLKVEATIGKQRLENERALEALRTEVLQTGLKTTSDIFTVAAEILGRDEASKKKHAATIKELQKANITINLVSEVSSIFANAQKSPVAQLLGPIAGNILAGIQAGAATARALIAIKKVEGTKFARGKFGFFGGKYHAHGGTQVVASDGSSFEVEKDEGFAIINRHNAPMLRQLSNINAMNGRGDAYFARGGLTNINTTPSVNLPNASTSENGGMIEHLISEFSALRSDMNNWQEKLSVSIVYSDIETAGKRVNVITNQAGF